MNNANLINQSSLKTEYYTPFRFVEAARRLMGAIDYDPASSERANSQIVKATRFCAAPGWAEVTTQADGLPTRYYHDNGGLGDEWGQRVWMNHPFGSKENHCKRVCTKTRCEKRGYHIGVDVAGNDAWINRIVKAYQRGETVEAVMICFASTSEDWFRPLLQFPKCWIYGRVNYLDSVSLEEIKGATKGSVITYFGNNAEGFRAIFSEFGAIHAPFVGRSWDVG